MKHYAALQQLLLPYLHQDWDLEFPRWKMAIDKAAKEQPQDLVRRALDDINRLLAGGCSPAVLRQAILELDISCDPGNKDAVAWLKEVRHILQEHVKRQ